VTIYFTDGSYTYLENDIVLKGIRKDFKEYGYRKKDIYINTFKSNMEWEGYQVGFEVAGVEVSIRSLMETIEKGSDIVVVAVFAKDPALSMFYLGEHELRLIGSMMYRHEDYLTAIDYVSKGIVNLKPLVSNRFAFEEYDDAYKFIDTHRETSMKVLIDFEQKPGEKK
jgi:threonine dehydrogenase-like Zn-dependent dehydrogenase